jgi:hypothetical protein
MASEGIAERPRENVNPEKILDQFIFFHFSERFSGFHSMYNPKKC